jgi:hypothetical protein
VLAWEPLPQLNLRKYFRGITLPEKANNYDPNGKSLTIGDLCPYHGKKHPWPPILTTKWVYMKYGLGFTLRLGYGDSEKSPLNLHY